MFSVVIVNWNGKEVLPPCLDSLYNGSRKPAQVIIVDNASGDNSVSLIRERYPQCQLISLENNLGFSGGANRALPLVTEEYLLLLNNDTVLHHHALEEMEKGIAENPECGMFALQIRLDDEHLDSAGIGVSPDGMSKQRYHNEHPSVITEAGNNDDYPLPSGCAALYRTELLRRYGFFDERFFAYCEDTDLGLRLCRAEAKSMLIKKAVVYHRHSYSHGKFSAEKVFYVERNHLLVAFKNFPALFLLLLPFTTFIRLSVQLKALSEQNTLQGFTDETGKGKLCLLTLKAWIDAVRLFFFRKGGKKEKEVPLPRLSPGKFCRLRMPFRELFK